MIIRLPEDVAQQLKLVAVYERMTVQDFCVQALLPSLDKALKKLRAVCPLFTNNFCACNRLPFVDDQGAAFAAGDVFSVVKRNAAEGAERAEGLAIAINTTLGVPPVASAST